MTDQTDQTGENDVILDDPLDMSPPAEPDDDTDEVTNDEDGEIGDLNQLPDTDDTHDPDQSADTGNQDDDPGVAIDDDPFDTGAGQGD